MAYNPVLAQKLQAILQGEVSLTRKEMFGGVGFLISGNMACGVIGDDLIVRVGPDNYDEALDQPHAHPFDFTGRPMKGWVTISPEGTATEKELMQWVGRGTAFARSLPPK